MKTDDLVVGGIYTYRWTPKRVIPVAVAAVEVPKLKSGKPGKRRKIHVTTLSGGKRKVVSTAKPFVKHIQGARYGSAGV